MEEHTGCAPVTANRFLVHDLSPDIDILENGRTISDFIGDKIKELASKDSEEPFFVASLDSLYMRHLRWITNLPRVKPFYAVKCNNTPAVLKMLSALGTGFDCASKVELEFMRITTVPLMSRFIGNLDRYTDNLLKLFRAKGGSKGKRIRTIMALTANNEDINIKRDCVLRSLSVYLNEDMETLVKEYVNEIKLVLSLGATPEDIIYAHTTKPLSHIKYAYTHGVNMMTFDNEDELLKVSLCHPNAKLVIRIAVDDSKSTVRLDERFGVRLESVGKLLERAKELNLEVIGVSFHVDSGCTGSLAFKRAITDARHAFDIANLLGFQMSLLDIGGGFPGRDNIQDTFEEFSEVINTALNKFFPPDSGVKVIAEPGRHYVESAFTLAANVIAKRVMVDIDEHRDGEDNRVMMYYLNEGVYGSLSCIIYDPTNFKAELYLHRAVKSNEQRYLSTIWGPTCDCTDKITDNYWIPELHNGDWLLMDNMGAYSLSLCTDFNGFERARIYTVVTAETWHNLNLSDTYNIVFS